MKKVAKHPKSMSNEWGIFGYTCVVLIGIIIFCSFMYGIFWVFKSVSYTIFYEDMVQGTVREMILDDRFLKPEFKLGE